MTSSNGTRIASAADWDASDVHTLPSGKTVRLVSEPPNVFGLAARYGLSDATVDGWLGGEVSGSQLTELAPAICRAMFVEPVVAEPDDDGAVPDGALSFDRLSNEDVAFVIELFGGQVEEVAEQAESFRGDGDGAGSSDHGEPVRKPAKRSGGTRARQSARR